MALRQAFFSNSRPIALLHEIVEVADGCDSVDADALRRDLDEGSAHAEMMHGYRQHVDDVKGSPHFFLADGSKCIIRASNCIGGVSPVRDSPSATATTPRQWTNSSNELRRRRPRSPWQSTGIR
jgi:hypothetical protein